MEEDKIIVKTNEFQTPITQSLLDKYPKEVQDKFTEYIHNIEFIRRLISPDRPRAKDLPRDEEGKIIVDVCNPHILENMDYFRPTGLHFLKYGKLTDFRINANPNSDFYLWMKEEIRRIWFGMVRESDGEWIPGEMYFYLNYMPMEITEETTKNSTVANRITSLPRVWEGAYLWYHYLYQARYGGMYDQRGGMNGIQVATRGASKSYSCASMLARLFVCGDNDQTNTNVISLMYAALKETLIKDGTLNKFEACIDHCAVLTQFPSERLLSSLDKMNWEMGYRDSKDPNIKKGTRNQVIGVTTNDNVDKGRGKRATKIIYEEIGAFPNFLDVWSTNEPSVSEGDKVWGQMVGIGTGGSKGSNFYGVMEMLYNPIGYRVYPLPNYFDLNSNGKGNTVFFFGAYLNREGFYNKDGVSDIVGTLFNILMRRYEVKYNSTDPSRLTRVIAERPITIQEAIMREEASVFPAAQLSERLNDLEANPTLLDDVLYGRMKMVNNEVEFDPTADVKVIQNFPHKDNKLDGGIAIFELPKKDKDGQVFSNRYIAGTDPVDDDGSNTMSLQSTFIIDLFTDQIVAEYTGRPLFADDYYEQLRLLLIFFNATDNYENNKKGLFGYFKQMNSLNLLINTLEYLKDKQIIKAVGTGNKSKGFNATQGVNEYARRLIKTWLLSPINILQEDENGELKEVTTQMLYTIKSKALLQELIQWNSVGNFDRVSSLGATMLYRQGMVIMYEGNVKDRVTQNNNKNYLGNDDFFKNNYKKSKNSKFSNNIYK